MTLEEARKIVEEQDYSDPARAIEAVAVVLRFHGIADQRMLTLAADMDDVAAELRAPHPTGGKP